MDEVIGNKYHYNKISLGKFASEKVIEEYIHDNISSLWKDIFNEEVINSKRQYAEIVGLIEFKKKKGFIPKRGVRPDLFIECKSGNKYIVEIKNSRHGQYQTIDAIGKILFYSVKFPQTNKFVILSTTYDEGFAETIKKYNLPICFILFGETGIYSLIGSKK